MKVWERIESLRKRMREEDIDVYYICLLYTSDAADDQ